MLSYQREALQRLLPKDRKSELRNQVGLPANPGNVSARRADIIITFAILLFAFSVRLLYVVQIQSIPLFYYLAGDSRAYDEWAQRIAAGDWLGQGVFYQAPLYPYFLGFLQFILGHDLWSIRLVQITLGAISCGLIFLAGRAFFGRALAEQGEKDEAVKHYEEALRIIKRRR